MGDSIVDLYAATPLLAALPVVILIALLKSPLVRLAKVEADARFRGIRKSLALFRDTAADRADLSLVGTSEVSSRIEKARHAAGGAGKRVFDILAATALLVFLAPLILLVALAIKLDSPGPVLYRQQRIGRGGRPFEILKFRSMTVDAEKDGVAAWAAKDDRRVTRVGRFIRKLRIDEFPQAINVIRGDMSFVGPRPERPEFVRLLEREIPNYHLRHVVRPGITGWAQVKYEYGASVEDARIKMQYDIYYLEHFSLWRDFLILLMTVRVALFGIGSR
ncbi:MAG: exopolysaccharide biosynthesis polyprenyl glycosylphosphotransferase [Parvularculaceae bacterium]|nr:exopolysaccharide biosynthesis polyprenyl glycosylphosphotransferase [Parvularculaceae bacterium]